MSAKWAVTPEISGRVLGAFAMGADWTEAARLAGTSRMTLRRAAEQLGRRCYGMEIDPRYCDVIVERWEGFTGEKATLERAAEPVTKPKRSKKHAA